MSNHNNEFHEQLSALVDGETASGDMSEVDDLLQRICCDDRNLKAWQAYHLARDIVQRDYHPVLPANFCASVRERLDSEEFYSNEFLPESHVPADVNVLPFEQRLVAATQSVELTDVEADFSVLARSNKRWKSAAALGLAASVVFAAVSALQFGSTQSGGETEIARLAPGSSTVEPIVSSAGIVPAVLTVGGTHWRDSGQQGHALKVEQQLNSYLTNHLEDAAMGKVKGMISHTRVVGYDSSTLRSEAF